MIFGRPHTFHFSPDRNFGPLAALPLWASLTLAATAGAGAVAGISSLTQSHASTINPNPTPTAAQTVDPSTGANVNNLGRAALIMTSPQGVQGTDATNKYALLGNQTGLGNK